MKKLGFVIALVALLGACGSPNKTNDAPTAHSTSATSEASKTLAVGDVTATVTVVTKACFGSAGCNVTYRVKPNIDQDKRTGKNYEVIYTVEGGTDGPIQERLWIYGNRYEATEGFTSTASRGVELTVRVNSVVEQ